MNTLEAQLAATEGSVKQLDEQLPAAQSKTQAVRAKLELDAHARHAESRPRRERRRRSLHARAGGVGREAAPVRARGQRRGRGADSRAARRDRRRRPGRGREDQGAARERALGALADGVLRAGRRHGHQPAAAAGPDGDRARHVAGDDLRRERVTRSSRCSTRTSCIRCSPATRPRSRSRRIPGRIIKATRELDRLGAGTGPDPDDLDDAANRLQALPPGRFAVRLDIAPRGSATCSSRPARSGHGAIYTQYVPSHPDPAQGDHAHQLVRELARPEAALTWPMRNGRRASRTLPGCR